MHYKLKTLIFTVLVMVLTAAAVNADTADTGWKGYGLYNLNKAQVVITGESDNVTINGSNVTAIYEYTINNTSGKSITVNFGYPDNGIYKFSINDGTKFLSYKTRDTSYLKANYGVQSLSTPDGRWYLFNMAFEPGQTRTIKVAIDSAIKKEANDTYSLSFFKDRDFTYAITGEKLGMTIKFTDFKPYYISELDGLKPEDISGNGEVKLSYGVGNGSGASLKYHPTDKMVIERLNTSEYKKVKAIAKAFVSGKYEEALALCDEYIKAQSDNNLNIEQVRYVRVECIRLSGKYEEYLKGMEEINTAKLYPARVGYKIACDRLEAYNAVNDDNGIDKVLAALIPDTEKNYPYLSFWLKQNGYELKPQATAGVPTVTPNSVKPAKTGKGFDVLGAVISFFTLLRDSKWTYGILGLLVGFLIGRLTKRNKRKGPVYLFRD
ncbi:MAG TPA: hypothetical protein VN549_00945 [Negativicutes bacterium]|nr:hypothetical protein [Negativicutes bacterium]